MKIAENVRVPISPGGTLPAELVVGRDALVDRYLASLEHLSLVLVAPRRVGKSSVCRRLAVRAPERFHVRSRDLQGLQTVEEFLAGLYEDVKAILPKLRRGRMGAEELLRALTGAVEAEAFKIRLPDADWMRMLETLLGDLERWAGENDRVVVLMWDEFTWFLHDMVQNGRARDAMKLLDRLRAARQSGQHARLRFVFTGSIGMEEVIDRLKAQGYGNDPFNDVKREVVPLMEPPDAATLARALIPLEHEALAPVLALVCEGHPYFLHHVAAQLADHGVWSEDAARSALGQLLESDQDPLELRQYLDRLRSYYADTRDTLVRLLDEIARAGRTVNELVDVLGVDRERVLELTDRLRRDLYLTRRNGRLHFRMELLRRFWILERGLLVDP